VTEPSPPTEAAGDDIRPAWFEAFLADRGTRKPSAHTMKAYRQDFDAIATLIVGEQRTGDRSFDDEQDYVSQGSAGTNIKHAVPQIVRCRTDR
jgi:integrase/recombinase XerC